MTTPIAHAAELETDNIEYDFYNKIDLDLQNYMPSHCLASFPGHRPAC